MKDVKDMSDDEIVIMAQREWMKMRDFCQEKGIEFPPKHQKTPDEIYNRGWIDALEWLQKHASGGGDWRRKIEQKISDLSKEV